MARRRSSRRKYKLVNADTVDMGSGGGQVMCGKVSKLDAQGLPNGYLNNIRVTSVLNDTPFVDDTPLAGGIVWYLTTSPVWNDNFIICARATPGGFSGTVNLPAHRHIRTDVADAADVDIIEKSNLGPVWLWAELTDISLSEDMEMRFIAETWGSYIEFEEVT